MANITIDPTTLANAIDVLESATLILSTAEHCGLASEIGDVRDFLQQISNAQKAQNCVCGNCDSPWTDPESDDYLDTHFECEGCGSDFLMDDELVVERWTTYEDSVTVYFCKKCAE